MKGEVWSRIGIRIEIGAWGLGVRDLGLGSGIRIGDWEGLGWDIGIGDWVWDWY